MGRRKHKQIVTANDLFEGDVIYLTGEGGWTRLHGDAAVAHDPDEAQRLLGDEALPLPDEPGSAGAR